LQEQVALQAGELQGNLLLDGILGAHIHWTDAALGDPVDDEKEALAARLRSAGRRPYVVGGGRGRLLGAVAYALQACELAEQCVSAGLQPHYVYLCASGAKTHPGLLLGLRALGYGCTVQGIAPIVWDHDVPAQAAQTAGELARELGLEIEIAPEDVRHAEEYVGPGYAVLSREAKVAIELVARTEGLLLDPCYTGKAMAGLIDHIRRGIVRPGSRVVFVHTGGTPALFAYAQELIGPRVA
jgi:L-cysteate sulfo-lyase